MKLLIVDDEPNMCHMLTAMVEPHGYEASVAENGRTALNLIKKERFDFILCDVKMPEVDGMSFLSQGVRYLEQTTVIMMSAYGTIDTALEAMKVGAYDYISKPFKEDEVLLSLKKAEERERLKEENLRLQDRIKKIAGDSKGFLYCVSSLGVTGVRSGFDTDFNEFFSYINESSNIPNALGFGISTPEHVKRLKKYCDGLIVGSAIVKLVEEYKEECVGKVGDYISLLRKAMDE